MNQRLYRNVGIEIAILAAISLLVFTAEPDAATPPEIAFSHFLTWKEDQQVDEVTIKEGRIHGRLRDGGAFTTYARERPSLITPASTTQRCLESRAEAPSPEAE